MPPVISCSLPRGRLTQASSCQRTRSTIAGAFNPADRYHDRSDRSPCSVSSSTTSRVHTRPVAAKDCPSSSANCFATNTTAEACATGSSRTWSSRRSGAGSVVLDGRTSAPAAKRCACTPGCPNRPSTSAGSSAARSPRRRRPRRVKRSIISGSDSPSVCNHPIGSDAQKAGDCSGSTTTGLSRRTDNRAATLDENRPSATPTPTRTTTPTSATTCCRCSATAASPPKYFDGPRAARLTHPGSITSSRGDTSATARTTGSNSRASRAGS